MTIIKPAIHSKIYYYLIIILAFVIPLHDKLVSPVIALITINWLLEFNFRQNIQRIKNSAENRYIIAFGLIYFLYILGTLYSSELQGRSGALFDLEVKLSLILFPIFFSTIDFADIKRDLFKKVLYFFILGCLINSIFIFNNAVVQYFKTQQSAMFFYSNLSMIYHPSYLALYYSLSIVILTDWILKTRGFTFKKVIVILMIMHFIVFVVLLSSKAGIIALLTALISIILYFIITELRTALRPVLICLSFIIAMIILLFIFPQSSGRFEAAGKALADTSTSPGQKSDGTAARIEIWKVSVQIIKENPFFGAGTGDVKRELLEKYKLNQIDPALHSNLNAHNQYLQTAIAIGIVGLIVLLGSLILPGVYAIKRKHLIYLAFLILFALHILVESMLERQAGVVFYAFFNVFLFRRLTASNKNSEHQLPPV